MPVTRDGDSLILPGLATAHSHAFQRALRGRTQRRSGGGDSFWSWRGLMYQLAEGIDPESIYAISRLAYAELAAAGVTAVGEFHYVHHQADGTPYDDRVVLAEAVVRAARDAGLRICLLRVLYARAGAGKDPEGAQRRFSDGDVDLALADVDTLAARFADDEGVTVGVAPHSVRAVPRPWIAEAARFAAERNLPLHMHVAEQRRELEECIAEHGAPPVRMLAEDGVLSPSFVAVHATHLADDEIAALGDAGAFVCVCRTTERDLGDGLCNAAGLVEAGARLCTGVDSHAISDPFLEARAIELDDRSRAEARHVAAEAPALLEAASANGYGAIGMAGLHDDDQVELDGDDPALIGAGEPLLDDAVMFAASPRAVRQVRVSGKELLDGGRPRGWTEIRRGFEAALTRLLA
jgi:formiminoglutamate deiminase